MLQQLQVELGQLSKDQGTAKGALYRPWMSWCLWVLSCHTSSSPRQAQGWRRAPGEEPATPPQPTTKHPRPQGASGNDRSDLSRSWPGTSGSLQLGLTHPAAGGRGCGSNTKGTSAHGAVKWGPWGAEECRRSSAGPR